MSFVAPDVLAAMPWHTVIVVVGLVAPHLHLICSTEHVLAQALASKTRLMITNCRRNFTLNRRFAVLAFPNEQRGRLSDQSCLATGALRSSLGEKVEADAPPSAQHPRRISVSTPHFISGAPTILGSSSVPWLSLTKCRVR